MWKKISKYFFKSPDEIGLDNYLVLVICFFTALLGILGTIINIIIDMGWIAILSTLIPTVFFTPVYLIGWKNEKYIFSKYIIIIVSLVLLNFQWFINFGSSGPILYLYVVVESFIIIFFVKKERTYLTLLVFINVTLLFLIEYRYPWIFGKYPGESARLLDLYSGLLIYLFLSILLLNIALKFYKSQQEKAQLADKLKSAFLANMSHEIRTPMNGILGFAELLKEPNLSGDEQQEFISIIEKSGQRMLNIINDIIDISKIESGLTKIDIQDTNINDQIAYIHTFFKHDVELKGITLSTKTSLSEEEAVIKTDPEKLYAILLNLVKNAIKFTHEGSIELGYRKKADVEQEVLEFYVKDTGIGIPVDKHITIFERFVQADINDSHAYQGAGLGLAISKAYVEMLSGKIRVESEPGDGATFYFTLPYNPEKKYNSTFEKSDQVVERKNNIHNLKILVVEDDIVSELLISREVRKFSREILLARTGLDAIEACRANTDIDLIFMDIKMPDMDGYEATREIRKFNKDVIIIAQTAFAMSGDAEKAIESGCNNYISKPIRNGVLNSMIQEYFRL
jgi:signal transduction histidine kinase